MLVVMTLGIEKRFDLVDKPEWIEKEPAAFREWKATIAASLTSISLCHSYWRWMAVFTYQQLCTTWESTPSPYLSDRRLCGPQSRPRRIGRGAWLSSRCHWICFRSSRVQLKRDGTRWRTGGEVKGKLANGVRSQYPFTLPRNMVYPALLPLMRIPRLPVVDWTDAPADLNGLVRFTGRRNLVSACVPSHFKRSLPVIIL